ncbi:glycosyl hydrolase family 88 [Niallia circulans]|uniref:Glycosyl hydrolase family 88 n=1 Tax=Niallia circulans TaxID=1397 RepID=A0A553SLT1_NIACI|nr:glycosyl hydrolase family 88 [Niallia circulans]
MEKVFDKKQTYNNWGAKAAKSLMERKPNINPRMRWEYEDGVVLEGMYLLWKQSGDREYLDYIKQNLDLFVDGVGNIPKYSLQEFNIDHVNNGKILIDLYNETKDERYKKAADLLREQLRRHPRTKEGSFWHKQIYPYQVWLDGLYMGSVFYGKYIHTFSEEENWDDVINQFLLCEKNTRDDKTGLLHHAYDETREQPWADKETGLSQHFWGRSVGWFAMALVDVLDYLDGNDQKQRLIVMLKDVLDAVMKFQDKETALWYQILDQGTRKGNYLESSCSCMFLYAIAKGVRKGYLDEEWYEIAEKIYEGVLDEFITETKEGYINVNKICYVGGLGGANKRDGSFSYYISEPIVTNDHKGFGPFILASAEMEGLNKGRR